MNDRVLAIILWAFSGFIFYETQSYPVGSKMLPLLLSALIFLLAIPLLLKPRKMLRVAPITPVLAFLAVVIISLLLLEYLGFLAFQVFLILAGLIAQRQMSFKVLASSTVIITGITYLVFLKIFQIPIPLIVM